MFAVHPVRELHWDVTIPGGHGSTQGLPVSGRPFAEQMTVVVFAGPTLAGPVTVTFESAGFNDTDICQDDGNWVPVNKGGFCSAAEAMQIVLDPADPNFVRDGQLICREQFDCYLPFIRAVTSALDPAVTAIVTGKARETIEN